MGDNTYSLVWLFVLSLMISSQVQAEEKRVTTSDAQEQVLWGADLAQLNAIQFPADLKILELADLDGGEGAIDDNSLKTLRRYEQLKTLILECPQMTDKGLKHISELKHLECLIIHDSKI